MLYSILRNSPERIDLAIIKETIGRTCCCASTYERQPTNPALTIACLSRQGVAQQPKHSPKRGIDDVL